MARSYIQKNVAIECHHFNQRVNEIFDGHVVGVGCILVESPTFCINRKGIFPFSGLHPAAFSGASDWLNYYQYDSTKSGR
jgi:hypothetical protein